MTFALEPATLSGQRVRLIPLRAEHAPALFEAGRAPKIWAYLPFAMRSGQDMEAFVQAALHEQAAGTSLPFAIEDRDSGRLVGSTRLLDFVAAHRQAEIGATWLRPELWRTRANSECKYLLLRHCFERLDLLRLQLKTDARNARSQAAIERLGAVREGVLRAHRVLPDGFVRDSVLYSILAREWPAVKSSLEERLS